jgi:hypothetical protein
MKTLIVAFCLACCGCTSTKIQYGTFQLDRVSFGQSLDVTVTKHGDDFMIEYGNDGGAKTAKGIAKGVIAGAALIK